MVGIMEMLGKDDLNQANLSKSWKVDNKGNGRMGRLLTQSQCNQKNLAMQHILPFYVREEVTLTFTFIFLASSECNL